MKQKVSNRDIQNIVEAITFIESEMQKDQVKLCKKVEEIQKMLTAINLRVSELEDQMYCKKQGITEKRT